MLKQPEALLKRCGITARGANRPAADPEPDFYCRHRETEAGNLLFSIAARPAENSQDTHRFTVYCVYECRTKD